MNLFDTVKAAVIPRMAAERYGLPIKQGNMVCCPFHDDRTPSMKLNEDYFYCFRLRGAWRCDRPCGKAVQPERL